MKQLVDAVGAPVNLHDMVLMTGYYNYDDVMIPYLVVNNIDVRDANPISMAVKLNKDAYDDRDVVWSYYKDVYGQHTNILNESKNILNTKNIHKRELKQGDYIAYAERRFNGFYIGRIVDNSFKGEIRIVTQTNYNGEFVSKSAIIPIKQIFDPKIKELVDDSYERYYESKSLKI